jgi:hypothetical protein
MSSKNAAKERNAGHKVESQIEEHADSPVQHPSPEEGLSGRVHCSSHAADVAPRSHFRVSLPANEPQRRSSLRNSRLGGPQPNNARILVGIQYIRQTV